MHDKIKPLFYFLMILSLIFIIACTPENNLDITQFDNHSDKLMACNLKLEEFSSIGDKEKAIEQIEKCKEVANSAIIDINRLSRDYSSEELEAARLDYEIQKSFLSVSQIYIETKEVDDPDEETAKQIKETLSTLNEALYKLYKLKKDYSETDYYNRYYPSGIQAIIDEKIKLNNELNQKANAYYDKKYGWFAKYFLLIDPADPTIVETTDSVLEPIRDEDKRKNAIYEFVVDKVEYKYDPNWKADWAQLPVVTLLKEEGDCEDMSILFVSMLSYAGIKNVELCTADVDGDMKYDHIHALIDDAVWDPTYKSKDKTASSDASEWQKKCFSVNEILKNPERATILECEEGYKQTFVKDEGYKCLEVCGTGICQEDKFCCVESVCCDKDNECCEGLCYYPCDEGTVRGDDCKCYNLCGGEICSNSQTCCSGQCLDKNDDRDYILGADCNYHEPCGSPNTYCVTGECCNGQCVTCPEGTSLGDDCLCY